MLRREKANRPRPTNTNSPNSTMARRVRLKAMRPLTIERALPYPLARSRGAGPAKLPRDFGCPRSHVMFLGAMQHALPARADDERHLIFRRSLRGVGLSRPASQAPGRRPSHACWLGLLVRLAGPFWPPLRPPLTSRRAEPGYSQVDAIPPRRHAWAPYEGWGLIHTRSRGSLFRPAGNGTIVALGWRRVTYGHPWVADTPSDFSPPRHLRQLRGRAASPQILGR